MMRQVLLCAFVLATVVSYSDAFYYAVNTPLNWWGANEYCRRAGHHLAVIDTREKQLDAERYLSENKLGAKHFWIALSDLATTNKYVWSSNGQAAVYTNWRPGQPDHYLGNEHCVHLTTSTAPNLFRWNDNNCLTKYEFLCESCC